MRRARQIAIAGVIGVAMVATPVIAETGPVAAVTAKPACQQVNDDAWPKWVRGMPSGIDPRTTLATYMWVEKGEFRIRVTHRNDNRKTFSGQLSTTGVFVKAHAVRLEKGDVFEVSPDRKSITFLFKNYGGIDGVDFRTRCAPSVKFAFQTNGNATKPSRIFIGRNNHHPRNNPFTIYR